MYDTTEIPQARATDPLTSKVAASRVNAGYVRNMILHCLQMNGPSDVWQISQFTGIKETTVSSQTRPLVRLGLIHEEGMRPSDETGRFRIVWAFGPDTTILNPSGEHTPMPQVKTGPRKTSDKVQFKPFTRDEIEEMNKKAQYLDTFTELLNAAVLDRVF
jgi:DNA-binding Lrp family transcriptional regulator